MSPTDVLTIRWIAGTYVPFDEALSCRFEGSVHAVCALRDIAEEPWDRILAIVEVASD